MSRRCQQPLRRRASVGLALVLVLGSGAGCYTPAYQPETVAIPPGAAAFAQLAGVVRARFGRLLVCDVPGRRLQSDWIDADEGRVPGKRRVSVFPVGAAQIGIVVELSWLHQRADATPYWTPVVGDVACERELAAAVRAALTADGAAAGR
jgi:hypothetical protein